jgi:hypothetical protein
MEDKMVDVVQLVRTSDCDSEGRGFESHHSPINKSLAMRGFFCSYGLLCGFDVLPYHLAVHDNFVIANDSEAISHSESKGFLEMPSSLYYSSK